MTARGKPVKYQTLLLEVWAVFSQAQRALLINLENELFLYNRQILSTSPTNHPDGTVPQIPIPAPYSPKAAPDTSVDSNNLEAWKSLFKDRRSWAADLTSTASQTVEEVQRIDTETSVIQRSAAIAVENIKQHLAFLRPKYESSKTWANGTLTEQNYLLSNWEGFLTRYSSIPAVGELGRCISGATAALEDRGATHSSSIGLTLRDLLDITTVRKDGDVSRNLSKSFSDRLADLTTTFEDIVEEASGLVENFSQSANLSDSDAGEQAARLMEEIEAVAKKINADYDYVLGLPSTPKSMSHVSRTALLHKRNFLPSLVQTISEIDQLWRRSIERKNMTVLSTLQYMQKIAAVESKIALVQSKLANLDVGKEEGQAFENLSFLIRLPSIYAYLLVECVRRREWTEKMTKDSSSLVEEIANFKEEEARRRKKWIKDMDGTVDLDPIDHMALGVDVNVKAQKQHWPIVTRSDVTHYIQSLMYAGSFDDTINEVEELMRGLDAPTKQQARKAKAFKNGSIQGAAYGNNSLLLRGDDETLKAMKSDKSKLEDKLKSSESRVRKLEDLLHRQSQVSRPSSSHAFAISNGTISNQQTTSPTPTFAAVLQKPPENVSRRSSVSSRRFSMHNEPEDKAATQRIANLEADVGGLHREAAAKAKVENDLRSQLQDVVSTNKDLLGNFEAQQREFDGERRSLEEENNKLKLKLEEAEDEIDRMLESRDQLDKIQSLEKELERVRKDAAAQVQKAQGQIDFLHNDYTMQREKANKLERQLKQQGNENADLGVRSNELSTRLQGLDEAQKEHQRSLRATLLHLSNEKSAPVDFNALVEHVESIAERSAAHIVELNSSIAKIRAQNASLEERAASRDTKVHELEEKLGVEEMEGFTVRESLAERKMQYSLLQATLEKERKERHELQARSAARDSNSEALEAEVADRDGRIAKLIGTKDDLEGMLQSLNKDLTERQSALVHSQKLYDTLSAHHSSRAARAEEISKRLYTQNNVLSRLLELVGLTITRQDDGMVISKTSRAVNASTVINDISTSMNRSLSSPLPSKSDVDTPIDPEILGWVRSDSQDVEARYFDQYIQEISSFDMVAFSEAITKRVKEADHIARKWQREARAYRDRSHRAQSEAHDKIAFRSFKEGDLALFLPTRNQATRPWAAFNVGAPHYFLREQDSHKLRTRDWLLARISKVEERMVDLSKSISGTGAASDGRSIGAASDGGASFDDENPFELSDGLRWFLLDAAEEKPGAPINIGLSKVTVASANVDAKGSIRMKKPSDGNGATKTLTRSLDSRRSLNSRRSSTNSKKGVAATTSAPVVAPAQNEGPSTNDPQTLIAPKETANPPSVQEAAAEPLASQVADEVRRNLLWGP